MIELLDRLIAAPESESRMAILSSVPERRKLPPVMPTFNFGPRKTLCELRPRHLHMVEEYGFRRDYDRNALSEYFLASWYQLFGALRKSKAHEVPSDALRKEIMITQLLALIEMRRDEYAAERATRSF